MVSTVISQLRFTWNILNIIYIVVLLGILFIFNVGLSLVYKIEYLWTYQILFLHHPKVDWERMPQVINVRLCTICAIGIKINKHKQWRNAIQFSLILALNPIIKMLHRCSSGTRYCSSISQNILVA